MTAPLAALLSLALLGAPSATRSASPSLALDQPAPSFGQAVTLTGTYQHVSQARQPQYPNQPAVQVNCTLAAGGSWQANQWTSNRASLGGGWVSSDYPFTLGGGAWSSGGATCSAVLYYFDVDSQLVELAFAYFEVLP